MVGCPCKPPKGRIIPSVLNRHPTISRFPEPAEFIGLSRTSFPLTDNTLTHFPPVFAVHIAGLGWLVNVSGLCLLTANFNWQGDQK